jgi:hypothetical protein
LGCGETGPTPLSFEREARVLVGGEALPASGCVRVEIEAAGAASERTCRYGWLLFYFFFIFFKRKQIKQKAGVDKLAGKKRPGIKRPPTKLADTDAVLSVERKC